MPVPVIELQRRLTLVGAIRAGGEKPERGPGRRLETWRLTSARQNLIAQAAELYGGTVDPWDSPNGREWQVVTDTDELPALLMPGYSLRQTYEQWEGVTKRMRLCDGIDEELSGQPCICNAEGVDRCDLYTRLAVALPELDTVLGWRLITRGANAGHELATIMSLVEARAGDHAFVPVRLRLDQRRGVKDGQVVRFVVPVVDLDVGYLALAAVDTPARGRSLPRGGVTPAVRPEPSVRDALASVASPPAPRQAGRRAADLGSSTPEPDARAPEPPGEPDAATGQQVARLQHNEPMWRKLNVLVAQLVEDEHITKAGLYDAIAGLRGVTGMQLQFRLDAVDDDGQVHWSPLRDDLARPEAAQLIDWLSEKQRRVAAASAVPAGPTRDNPGEFPEGY